MEACSKSCVPREAGGPSGGEQSQGQRRGPSAHIGEVPSWMVRPAQC